MNSIIISANFAGLLYRVNGFNVRFDQIVYMFLMVILALIFAIIIIAFENIKNDQLKSAMNKEPEIQQVHELYQSIQHEYQCLLNNLEEAIIVFRDDNSIKFANSKFSNLVHRLDIDTSSMQAMRKKATFNKILDIQFLKIYRKNDHPHEARSSIHRTYSSLHKDELVSLN